MLDIYRLDRRHMLLGAALATVSSASRARGDSVAYELMVAGPSRGRLDRWADVLSPVIARTLSQQTSLGRQNVGGIDGVTGANQLEVRGEPDGHTALLVPGDAVLAWMVGDMRARFDPTRWIPIWAGTAPGVLVSRIRLHSGQKVKIAATGPVGATLPFLMALDLIGMEVVLTSDAFSDAALMTGPHLGKSLSEAARLGLQPAMTLGRLDPSGRIARDPAHPSLPTAAEIVQGRASTDMIAALQATSIAVLLDAGLVLPALTPASAVSLWRRACGPFLTEPAVLQEASARGIQLSSPDVIASCTNNIVSKPSTLLALRTWLSIKQGWNPT